MDQRYFIFIEILWLLLVLSASTKVKEPHRQPNIVLGHFSIWLLVGLEIAQNILMIEKGSSLVVKMPGIFSVFAFSFFSTGLIAYRYTLKKIYLWGNLTLAFIFYVSALVWFDRSPVHHLSELNSAVLSTHIYLILLSLALSTNAFVSGLIYWTTDYFLKRKQFKILIWIGSWLPSLVSLSNLTYRFALLCSMLLSFGILLGLYLGHSVWQNDWQSQPKLWGSIFVWLFYVIAIFSRRFFNLAAKKFVLMVSLGLFLILIILWIALA